ncbi:MAG: hypothetical protein ACKN9T_02680 [Candidatus Methylumidiphilus sp.]
MGLQVSQKFWFKNKSAAAVKNTILSNGLSLVGRRQTLSVDDKAKGLPTRRAC